MTVKIDMKEWFDYVILMRGKEYFFDGRVVNIKRVGLRYKAKVLGSKLYNVDVIIDHDENVVDMECNCPYAVENYCKHMAATIYSILENNNRLENDNIIEGKKIDYKEIISRIPKEKLSNFLIENLQGSQYFQEKFENIFFEYFPKFTKREYLKIIKNEMKKAINDFQSHYYDDYDYDYDYDSYDYEGDEVYSNTVSNVIIKYEEEATKYIKKCDFKSAYIIITALFESLPIEELKKICEFYDSIIEYGVHCCISKFKLILRQDSEGKFKNQIFEYCIDALKDKEKVIYSDDIINFLLEDDIFTLNIYLDEKVKMLDNVFPEFKKYNGISENIPTYVKKYANYLNMLNRKDDALKVIKENIQDHDILYIYIDIILKEKKYNEAIDLLKAEIKKDNRFQWKYSKWDDINKLLEVYLECGKKDEIRKLTEKIIYNDSIGNLEYLKILKSTYTKKEWDEKRDLIVTNIEKLIGNFNSNTLRELYVEEKMYDKLFISVMANPDYYTLVDYEKYLKLDHEKTLLEKYKNISDKQVEAVGRRNYEHLQEILKHIKYLKRRKRTCK